MKKVKIPKNRIRKLKTFSLGKKSFELLSSTSQNKLIDLCSNDYFGLSRDNDLIKAAYEISLLEGIGSCLLYTSPSPRDRPLSRMPSSA